jgi:hypothetical protein
MMETPLINPDESKALRILCVMHAVLVENPMQDYASYAFIGHQIAILIDKELRRINEIEKLKQSGNFEVWMHKQMGC